MAKRGKGGDHGKGVWVTPKKEVKIEGHRQAESKHRTQGAAERAGKRLAKELEGELIVQRSKGENRGQIRSKDSFGPESDARDTEH